MQRLRALIALDPGMSREHSLRVLASLGMDVGAEVVGLFVEDVTLLRLAGSQVAREVTLDACEGMLGAVQMERQLRAQAARLRTLLESEASRTGLRCRFQVTRGELAAEVLRAAAVVDVIVMPHSRINAARAVCQRLPLRHLIKAGPRTVVFVQENWSTGRRIAVLFRGREDEMALTLAVALARAEHLDIAVLIARGQESQGSARESLERLGQGQVRVQLRPISRISLAELLGASHAEDARVLILPEGPVAEDPEMINELLKRADCSLIIVR